MQPTIALDQMQKLPILTFFPFQDLDPDNGDTNYYSKASNDDSISIAGLETNNGAYELFTWAATDIETQLIEKFQATFKETFGTDIICNNY